ncbi:MAG: Phosphoglycolate phosphatase [Anaerolineales bacterium]|nr:Phosphoglycolate phosphatase [Anaerolineales bacterium]
MIWDKYKAVIFDCDDTIIATAKNRWTALIKTANDFGQELNEATIRNAWGKPFDQLIATLVPEIEFETFFAAYKIIMRSQKTEATSGAAQLLKKLYEEDVRMEIVTSSSRELIIQDLDELDLTKYFADIFGYEGTRYYKPDPRVLAPALLILEKQGYKLSEVLYVGDSIRDYKAAIGNRLDFVAVTSGLEQKDVFLTAGLEANNIISSLIELL